MFFMCGGGVVLFCVLMLVDDSDRVAPSFSQTPCSPKFEDKYLFVLISIKKEEAINDFFFKTTLTNTYYAYAL